MLSLSPRDIALIRPRRKGKPPQSAPPFLRQGAHQVSRFTEAISSPAASAWARNSYRPSLGAPRAPSSARAGLMPLVSEYRRLRLTKDHVDTGPNRGLRRRLSQECAISRAASAFGGVLETSCKPIPQSSRTVALSVPALGGVRLASSAKARAFDGVSSPVDQTITADTGESAAPRAPYSFVVSGTCRRRWAVYLCCGRQSSSSARSPAPRRVSMTAAKLAARTR